MEKKQREGLNAECGGADVGLGALGEVRKTIRTIVRFRVSKEKEG